METVPILLICGCKKYINSLKKAIVRMANPKYKVIGVIGNIGHPTDFNEKTNIVSLQIDDSYEALPFKIQKALEWVFHNFPKSIGVFKTDDDIYFEDYNILADEIINNSHIPYWGLKIHQAKKAYIDKMRINSKYTDKNLQLISPTATYCWGAGYWLSRKSMYYIINSKHFRLGNEDVLVGYVLNKHGIFPVEKTLKWETRKRKTVNKTKRNLLSVFWN
jgi:hypothetical protein